MKPCSPDRFCRSYRKVVLFAAIACLLLSGGFLAAQAQAPAEKKLPQLPEEKVIGEAPPPAPSGPAPAPPPAPAPAPDTVSGRNLPVQNTIGSADSASAGVITQR